MPQGTGVDVSGVEHTGDDKVGNGSWFGLRLFGFFFLPLQFSSFLFQSCKQLNLPAAVEIGRSSEMTCYRVWAGPWGPFGL